ncbi:hypothetical protein KUTeg_015275 [Tegillarca granosa]|uniref:Uncharacterized protein n=1 Tax=Tegillarca granosa TaxID=220873 RepID=A0ABQ9EPM4_TEGGR|nr:hypothetical protein KUTeg_015275 [Tegillarca granosa]
MHAINSGMLDNAVKNFEEIEFSNEVNSKALPWTTEDIKAVERRLHKFLQLQKTPGKKDREEATSKEKVLNNRSWEKYKNIQCL